MGFASDNPVTDYLDGNLPTAEDFVPAEDAPEAAAPEDEAVAEASGDDPGVASTEPAVVPAADIDWNQRVTEWGGEEAIQDAISIAQALQDDEGVKALVTEGLRHLGFDPDAVLAGKATTAAEPAEDEDPDRLITAAEVEARIQAIRDAQVDAERATADAAASQAVSATLDELALANEDETRMVLNFAQKFAAPEERDPAVLAAAIKAGHAEYIKTLQEAAQRYVSDRKDANDAVPTPLTSGGSPGGEEAPPVKNLEEARLAARKYLQESGDL